MIQWFPLIRIIGADMKTSKLYRSLVAGLGTSVLFATVAQAADLGSYASPAPLETWTGFSVGVGGGRWVPHARANLIVRSRADAPHLKKAALAIEPP